MKKYPVEIKISEQRLCLYADKEIIKSYPVSTSKYGVGNKSGRNKTPKGWASVPPSAGRHPTLIGFASVSCILQEVSGGGFGKRSPK